MTIAVRDLDFAAEAELRGGVLLATISGNADLNVSVAFDRFLSSLHAEATRSGLRKVVMDVRGLQFITSSCLKAFVLWVHQVADLGPEQRYLVTFLSSTELHWQRRSLSAILALAPEIVTIET